jgi:hypothetical protein
MKGAFNMATIYLKNKVKIYVKKNAEKLIQDIENSSDNVFLIELITYPDEHKIYINPKFIAYIV